MSFGTVTQKFGKISWLGATAYIMAGVSNWMPMLGSGTARSVAPVGPVVMPGADGMPSLLAGVPASATAVPPPEELLELDEVLPPELPPLVLPPPVVPLLEPPPVAAALPPPSSEVSPFGVEPVPVLALGSENPPVLSGFALQAMKPKAITRVAPAIATFTFGLDVCIITSPPTLLGSLGAP